MAGGMNLATKYSKQIDERWYRDSQVSFVTSDDKFNFHGDKTVVVYSIPIAPLNDYQRSGSNRYGTIDDLSRNKQTLVVSQDKAFTFVIDKGDEIQSEYVSDPAKALARQIREVIVPSYDRYCFGIMAQSAKDHGNYDSTAITASNAYEMLLKGTHHMANRNVPISNVICYCTYEFYGFLLRDSAFVRYGNLSQEMLNRGQFGKCGGVEIVAVPDDRLPQGASFLLVHKDSIVAPHQLEEYKLHSDAVGYSGTVVEGRAIYDCFVLEEKSGGVYYHGGQSEVGSVTVLTSATSSGKTTVIVCKEKDTSTNKWYVITATKMSLLPTVTFGTAIDDSSTGVWHDATVMSSNAEEITPNSGDKVFAFVETDSSKKPLYYTTGRVNMG